MLSKKVVRYSCCLLFLPPGEEYLYAFFGCLLAGVIAIPAYPPRNNKHLQRIKKIIENAGRAHIITVQRSKDELSLLAPVSTIEEMLLHDSDDFIPVDIEPDQIAFLQYTSGSTGDPKGVMVTHRNLIANSLSMHESFRGNSQDVFGSWVPPYHDMGLIGCIIYPLVVNMKSVLMLPTTFIKKPYLWLKAISDYKITISPSPNFAYELWSRTVKEEEKKQLDLKHWRIALNGAEPVNYITLKRFADAFVGCGLKYDALFPAYGLAEATLMVSGGQPATICRVDKQSFLNNEIQIATHEEKSVVLVSSGQPNQDFDIQIINPKTSKCLKPYQIGEIICNGPSVTQGYWNAVEQNKKLFVSLPERSDEKYLRTGDLGFLDEKNNLYVTGRIKDLVIIHGRNYYPQDIELTVADSYEAFGVNSNIVFAHTDERKDKLVIVQEIPNQTKNFSEVVEKILSACMDEHEILPDRVVLIKKGSLPRTSSGKVQRNTCRRELAEGKLVILHDWQSVSSHAPDHEKVNMDQNIEINDEISNWMMSWLANHLHLRVDQIDPNKSFAYYGFDSMAALQFCDALQNDLLLEVNPTLLWQYPTVNLLTGYLTDDQQTKSENRKLNEHEDLVSEPIAIIGIGCRFPGDINSPEEYWNFLCEGGDGITEAPDDHEFINNYCNSNPESSIRRGGFIKNIKEFDAALFNISPIEAEVMDPQHRILLEVTWDALERAHIDPLSISGSDCGVFIGLGTNDFGYMLHKYTDQISDINPYFNIGNSHSAASGRIAYFYNLHGQVMSIDTACSASLVAVYNAFQNLRNRKCNLAIAGGVNSIIDPIISIGLTKANMLAPDGKCKVFDASADGYVRSEGCGLVILKRLSDAQKAGDDIIAIIKAVETNHDGASNGITAPNAEAQKEIIVSALSNAKLAPDNISYIEAHGTGTKLGDPIEMNVLSEVFSSNKRKKPLYVGSVKSNIGHLETAARIAGFIKVALMLKNKKIPKNLHFNTLNPLINLKIIPADIPLKLLDWELDNCNKRYAGVCSFGFTGTNVHAILEEAAEIIPEKAVDTATIAAGHSAYLFTLSGHTSEALQAQIKNYLEFIRSNPEIDLAQLCYNLYYNRSHLQYRLALTANSLNDLENKLISGDYTTDTLSLNNKTKISFLFTGQGAQYPQMGKMLYQHQPVFKSTVDECSKILEQYLPISLLEILFGENEELLNQTQYTQPALFTIDYALAKLWQSQGITPSAVIGHSVGEYAAAAFAGIMSLEDSLKLISLRGKLMQSLPKGYMLALNGDQDLCLEVLSKVQQDNPKCVLDIAAFNSSEQIVVSGDLDAIELMENLCQEKAIRTIQLNVSHAFHSRLMMPILDEFRNCAQNIHYSKPNIEFISNLTGLSQKEIDADYWTDHIIKPVKFADGILSLINNKFNVFIETGPQPILINFAKYSHPQPNKAKWLPSMKKNQDDYSLWLSHFEELYLFGIPLDWRKINNVHSVKKLNLPTYPFQRKLFWPKVLREASVLPENPLEKAIYSLKWQEKNLTASAQPDKQPGTWLIFTPKEYEIGQISIAFQRQFEKIIYVQYGDSFQNVNNKLFTINPNSSTDFSTLFTTIPNISGLIYLWGLDFKNEFREYDSIGEINNFIKISCDSLLKLVNEATKLYPTISLWTITHSGLYCTKNPTPPMASPLIGLSKVINIEFPELNYNHIDLADAINVDKIAEIIAREISANTIGQILAYDNDYRFVPVVSPYSLPPQSQPLVLKKDATYLITGGMGGLGLEFCKSLISKGAKYIAVLGRRTLDDKMSAQLQALAGKATVNYYAVNVANYTDLEQFIVQLTQSMPPLKGIFHSAGVLRDCLIPNHEWQQFSDVCEPKISGGWNLHQVSQKFNLALDYFVLFSSISSLLGSYGQANYAAANSFLDALAYYRQSLGLPALSINFGPWANIGMTLNHEQPWLRSGVKNIPVHDGMRAICEMIRTDLPQLILLPNEIQPQAIQYLSSMQCELMHELLEQKLNLPTEEVLPAEKGLNLLIEIQKADFEGKTQIVLEFLIKEVTRILKLSGQETIVNNKLLELGMDSITGMELFNSINDALPKINNLSVKALMFENRTIKEIAAYIIEMLDAKAL